MIVNVGLRRSIAPLRKYGSLPGAAGSYFSTPDSVANSITGDIDIRVKANLASWIGNTKVLVAKWNVSNSYVFGINAGVPVLITTGDGSTNRSGSSTAAAPFADNTTGWLRVTRASATGNTNFYSSQDGVTWTQLGTADVATTAGAIFDSATGVEVGSLGVGTSWVYSGKIYRAQIYNGIDGTLAVDFNPNSYSTGTTWTSTTGEVWTINGSATVTR